MIDLHCHILPTIDDGAADLGVSLDMARAAVADGVSVVACTPHILPGLYNNAGPQIVSAVKQLQGVLEREGIPLRLVAGADIHMAPDVVTGLRSGRVPSLAGSRYVLIEPPHHTAPPLLEPFFFGLLLEGFVPILTHPERLSWLSQRYETVLKMVRAGVWMQITSGSLAGAFGRKAQYWAHRMLDEECVHLLATDAHDTQRRPPDLSRGLDLAAARIGIEQAEHLVRTRPQGVLENKIPAHLPMPSAVAGSAKSGWSDQSGYSDTETIGSAKWIASPSSGRANLRSLVGRLLHLIGPEHR